MNEDIFRDLTAIEESFHIIEPYVEVEMGVFDASTGIWEGLSSVEVEYSPAPGKPPRPKLIIPVVNVNAVNVGLVFRVKNSTNGFSVSLRNNFRIPSSHDSLTINIHRAKDVDWTIYCNDKTYSDHVAIERPPIIGAGAFSVEVFPIAIIYEPPQVNKENRATYEVGSTIGTAIATENTFEQSSTKPLSASWSSVPEYVSALNKIREGGPDIEAVAKIPVVGKLYSDFLGLFSTALGSVDVSEIESKSSVLEHDLVLKEAFSDKLETQAHEGPGSGDIILCLRNAKVIWLYNEGHITLSLLGWSERAAFTAGLLLTDYRGYQSWPGTPGQMYPPEHEHHKPYEPITRLSLEGVRGLLELDPFVWQSDNTKTPSAGRFRLLDTYSMNGVSETASLSYSIESSDVETDVSFTTYSADMKPGWLSFLGFGITESEKVGMTLKMKSSARTTDSLERKVSATFVADNDQYYSISVFLDRLFGTFAFRTNNLGNPSVYGLVTGRNGKPLANELVTLAVDGAHHLTHTNREGWYEFREVGLGGPGSVKVGRMAHPVKMGKAPMRSDFTVAG